jgi:MFS family permease
MFPFIGRSSAWDGWVDQLPALSRLLVSAALVLDTTSQEVKKMETAHRNVWLLLGVWACIGFGYTGVHAVLFNLYLLRLGYGPEFVGTANSALMLTIALLSFPSGWLGRRFGPRRVLIVGQLVLVGYVVIPLAQAAPLHMRSAVLVLTMVCVGAAAAAILVNTMPFLMINTTPERRNLVFSIRAAIAPLFAFAGSFFGGVLPGIMTSGFAVELDSAKAYGLSLLIVPLLFALGLGLLFFTKEADKISRHRERTAGAGKAPLKPILLLALVNLLVMAAIRPTQLFFNVYMDAGLHAPTVLIGVTAGVGQLLSVPSALLMPVMAKRLGRPQLIAGATALLLLSELLLSLIPHWVVAGLCFAGVTAASSVFNSAFAVQSQELVAADWRAVTAGTVTAARGLSTSAMVFGGGFLVSALGHRPLFLLNAIVAAIAAIVFLLSRCLWTVGGARSSLDVQRS